MIPKPGGSGKLRKLGIPTISDRVVQAALKLVLVAVLLPVAFIAVAAYLGAKGIGWRSDYCQSAD